MNVQLHAVRTEGTTRRAIVTTEIAPGLRRLDRVEVYREGWYWSGVRPEGPGYYSEDRRPGTPHDRRSVVEWLRSLDLPEAGWEAAERLSPGTLTPAEVATLPVLAEMP